MIASHCGRPKGQVNDKMRMAPMATRLGELIGTTIPTSKNHLTILYYSHTDLYIPGKQVSVVDDCIGDHVDTARDALKEGEALMLENVRFHKEEEKNVEDFAKQLAKGSTIYVNDAFGTAHR